MLAVALVAMMPPTPPHNSTWTRLRPFGEQPKGSDQDRKTEMQAAQRGSELPNRGRKANFTLKTETCNSTSWSAAKAFLETTGAHVVCLQEHRLPQEEVAEASAWAIRAGWKSVWSAAVQGEAFERNRNATSGGVALFCRKWLGMTAADQDDKRRKDWPFELWPGRLVAAKVLVPGGRPIIMYSSYLVCGEELGPKNRAILEVLGKHIDRHRYEWAAGGDYNLTPEKLALSEFCKKARAVIRATKEPTCMNASPATLDFFLLSAGLPQAPSAVTSARCEGIRPHRVVQLEFEKPLQQVKVRRLRVAKAQKGEQPYGPRVPPQNWAEVRRIVERNLDELRKGPAGRRPRGCRTRPMKSG